jgi:hypothetical protein
VTDDAIAATVRLVFNAQQLDFIDRMRRQHYPDLTIEEMVRQALADAVGAGTRPAGPGLKS